MNVEVFLEARFAEELELAMEASRASFRGGDWQDVDTVPDFGATVSLPLRIARHASYWSPDRVVAEVAARQKVLNIYKNVYHDHDGTLYKVVCAMALPYIQHPDFQAEWLR